MLIVSDDADDDDVDAFDECGQRDKRGQRYLI